MPPVSVRVAAAQFAVGSDRTANLAAVLRAVAAAAGREADLVVLPEFCNHLSWYEDREHALREACVPGDAFLTEVAAAAARHRLYVKLHVTLATPAEQPVPGRTDGMRVTAASLLFAPDGTLAGRADKQTLMGSENDHLDPAESAGPVVATELGPVGLYSCMEGVINEVCRSLSLRGARLLLNSLNSFALDEASLHIPVRAAENKVWVIAANKVGPLIPEAQLAAVAGVSASRPRRCTARVRARSWPRTASWSPRRRAPARPSRWPTSTLSAPSTSGGRTAPTCSRPAVPTSTARSRVPRVRCPRSVDGAPRT